MKITKAGRALGIALLAVAALTGAGIRSSADPTTTLHALGTLMMVMWIPIASFVVLWFAKKRRPIVTVPQSFVAGSPFVQHGLVQMAMSRQAKDPMRAARGEFHFIALLGSEGFTARVLVADGPAPSPEAERRFPVQFLVPGTALPRLPAGTEFHVLVGREVVGRGRVLDAASNA